MGRSGRTKFADGFAGAGGFRIALEPLGHECVWSCENDKYARQVYRYHWDEEIAGDIRKVDAKTIPDFDIFCAGFPCPDFSIAGGRKGLEGTRGELFYEIIRIARVKRPSYLFLENVKGLLSSNAGWDFARIQIELGECGYDLQWQILNSKNYGVPQNRERVFIIGHLRDRSRPQVFPIGENDGVSEGENGTEQRSSQTQISGTLRGANTKADHTFIIHNVYGGFNEDKPRVFEDVAPTIRTPKRGGHLPMVVHNLQRRSAERPSLKDNPTAGGHGHISKDDGTTYCLEQSGKQAIAGARIRRSTPLEYERLQGIMVFEQRSDEGIRTFKEGICGSLRTIGDGGDKRVLENGKIRRLTPLECERLQGFPDFFTKWGIDEDGEKVPISDTQRYKMMGNAITIPVVEAIARKF